MRRRQSFRVRTNDVKVISPFLKQSETERNPEEEIDYKEKEKRKLFKFVFNELFDDDTYIEHANKTKRIEIESTGAKKVEKLDIKNN